MRIGIVAMSAFSGAAISELINQTTALDKEDQQNHYYIFLSKNYHIFKDRLPLRHEKIYISILPSNNLFRSILVQILLPFYIKWLKIDLIYCLGNIALLFSSVKTIVLVQNATPFSRVRQWSFYQKIRHKVLTFLTMLSVRKANLVLYVSQNSKQLFNKSLKIKEEKTRVIYHGWYPQKIVPHPQIKLNSDINFIYVGAIFPYKNIEIIMKAFDKIVEATKGVAELLIIGSDLDKKYYDRLYSLKLELKNGAKIKFLMGIDYRYIFWFYSKSKMLIFSSVEETFGIPLIEAMGVGLPIIAADTQLADEGTEYFNPSKEICQEAALYYNPYKINDLAEKMLLLLRDHHLVNRLQKAALKQINRFDRFKLANDLIHLFNNFNRKK